MSQHSSAASSNTTASSASSAASNTSASSAQQLAGASLKSSAAPSSGVSEPGSSSKSGDTTITESDVTERSISEIGGISQASVSAATQYDRSVADAVSVMVTNAKNFENYSHVGPVNKDQQKSFVSQVKQIQSSRKVAAAPSGKLTGRKVFIMRHGERMDRTFPEWLTVAITDEGRYRPYDMNQPLTLIERVGGVGWAGYEYDGPITEMGGLSSQMIGRGLKSCGVDIKRVVSSPALRCVQSANALLKAFENPDLKISVEPGLFEWLTWYDKMPQWFDPQTLKETGKFRINELYKPILTIADLVTKQNETTKQYCERVANVTKQLMDQFKDAGTTLIVGHGSTMDCVGRSLLGKPIVELDRGQMDQMGINYPYCSIVAVEEQEGGKWRVIPSALPQLSFLGFSNRFSPDCFSRP